MPTLVSPQVYFEEVDKTTFVGEASGPVGAVVLRNTYKGRENDKILIATETELVTKFGSPSSNADCYRDIFSAIAFLKESNNLYCTRTMPISATFAGTTATSGTSATFTAFTFNNAPILSSGVGQVVDPDEYPDYAVVSGTDMMKVICKDRGYCGNMLRIAVCDKTHYDLIRQKNYTAWDTYSSLYAVDAPLDSNKEFIVIVQECTQGYDADTESNWSTVEWWNVSTDENKYDDVGQPMYVENVINTNSQYIRVSFNGSYNNTNIVNFVTSAWQRLSGGSNNNTATNLTNAVTNATVPDATIIAAVDLYNNAEEINLDVIIDSDKPEAVKTEIVTVAKTRKDCMAVLDCLSTHVINQSGSEETNLRDWMISWRGGNSEVNTSYGAIYANWLDIYDKYNNKYRWIPASGYVAAIYARCQNQAQYWSTPAGFIRGKINNVRRLAWNPTQTQRDAIYKYSWNPIVSFANQGKVVYGHKTLLDKYSAFNRVNVRRLFISIETDIASIARNYLFESNNTFHRNAMVSEIRPVLNYAKANDGIDDYKIICDTTNNTPERIARNEMWVDIYVKPTYAADYIIITFVATKDTTDFSESV